jgi:stage III sporulation protein AG
MSGDKENFLITFLKDIWKGGHEAARKKNYFLFILLILGIILMFSSSFFGSKEAAPYSDVLPEKTRESSLTDSYEKELMRSLRYVLEQIDGISDVHVVISFEKSEEFFYAQALEETLRETSESDREGGVREIHESTRKQDYVLLREPGGGEIPLLLSENMPRVSGIMVVAKGAENSSLRLKVVRAIQSLLNLPVHRIAVLPLG